MKLYIRQKVFSWRDKFTVKDWLGRDVYEVKGQLLSIGKKLFISDKDGNEVASVKQQVVALRPKYHIYVGGREVGEIVKEITLMRPKYKVKGLGWEVTGSFLEHDYSVREGRKEVIGIHKQWMSWGDCYELDIDDKQDALLALAVVLAIDCATEGDNAAIDGIE